MSKIIILGTKYLRCNSTGSVGPEVRQNTHTMHMDHLVTAGKKLAKNTQITSIRLSNVSIIVLALIFIMYILIECRELYTFFLLYCIL